jgi:hypothetical protein
MTFQELLEDAGFETRAYSGRFMYGSYCLGFVTDQHFGQMMGALFDALAGYGDELDPDVLIDAVEMFRTMRWDNMGRDEIIVYFPSIPYAEAA